MLWQFNSVRSSNMNKLNFYKKQFSLHNAMFSLIEHEDAMVAPVYKIINAEGEQFILKICENQHHYFREVYFLKYFADKLPVPRVIQFFEPIPNYEIIMPLLRLSKAIATIGFIVKRGIYKRNANLYQNMFLITQSFDTNSLRNSLRMSGLEQPLVVSVVESMRLVIGSY